MFELVNPVLVTWAGPNFLGESQVVAGVTSFGLNGNCAGTGGVFRIDRRNVLDFVGPYLP